MANRPKNKGRRPSKDEIKAKAERAEARSKGKPVEKSGPPSGVLNPPTHLGRPTKYTEALATEICARLANGETLTSICRDAHMPARRTVLDWKANDLGGFSARYARAREEQRELWQDEMLDMADDGRNDWMEREIGRGETIVVLNKEAVDRSKLRVGTRQWLLARLSRDTYGDKIEQTHKADEGFLAVWQMMSGENPKSKK